MSSGEKVYINVVIREQGERFVAILDGLNQADEYQNVIKAMQENEAFDNYMLDGSSDVFRANPDDTFDKIFKRVVSLLASSGFQYVTTNEMVDDVLNHFFLYVDEAADYSNYEQIIGNVVGLDGLEISIAFQAIPFRGEFDNFVLSSMQDRAESLGYIKLQVQSDMQLVFQAPHQDVCRAKVDVIEICQGLSFLFRKDVAGNLMFRPGASI